MRSFNQTSLYSLLAVLLGGLLLPISALAEIHTPQAEIHTPQAEIHAPEEVRAAYARLGDAPEGTPYAVIPSAAAPYETGSLREDALQDALDYLNFLRYLAYLDAPVGLDANLNEICQYGAVLLASIDRVDHQADNPGDMPEEFYRIASYATNSSNLAAINWMKGDILRTALEYFARDDGEQNLPILGHRRWILNPLMGATGFGLANASSGMTYAVMFAHDLSAEARAWQHVCWPSAGAFPAELMQTEIAWSVTLNPAAYDLAASTPQITMHESVSGAEFHFDDPVGACADGYFTINRGNYGGGPCLIFRPDMKGADLETYQQNQRWEIAVSGLKTNAGEDAEISYAVQMIALHAIDPASVEISSLEATLSVGETTQLSAAVIPAWADDLSITWSSSDPQVATVDGTGLVTARAAGTCEIAATSVNGHADTCVLTVTE